MSSGKLKIIWLQNEVSRGRFASTWPAYSPSSTAKHQSHYHSHSGSLGAVLRQKPIKENTQQHNITRYTTTTGLSWELVNLPYRIKTKPPDFFGVINFPGVIFQHNICRKSFSSSHFLPSFCIFNYHRISRHFMSISQSYTWMLLIKKNS